MTPLATHVERAGLAPGTPVAVARSNRSGVIEEAVSGAWPNGRPVVASDRFYVASIAKQFTGAAAALLVREGRLDPDLPVASYLSALPAWSADITPRHLAHHIAGLPLAGEVEARAPGDWTEAFVGEALSGLCDLSAPPGTTYAYSNLGYILLARVVAEVSGQPFDRFVATRLLEPLGIDGVSFPEEVAAQPQAALMGPGLPLTLGDGGLWSTARGMAHWLHQQNLDALGIASLVEARGRLIGGEEVAYGWGLGLRRHLDQPLLIHGGEWTGAVAKAVRSPALGLSVVAMAAGAPFEQLDRLIGAVLNDLSW